MDKINDKSKLSSLFFNRFFEDWNSINPETFLSFLRPKIEQAITLEELEKLVKSGKRLKIKLGIDPTGPDVHLGHLLPFIVLRQFQRAGHEIHLIIGDFTALIGDPSGRNTQRPQLSAKQIKSNFATYKLQIGRYLDVRKIKKIHRNSKWLSKIKLGDIIRDLSQVKMSEILQRNDFRERLEKNYPLSVAEILYSYAQSMDSVVLGADIEVGGNDQLLNFAQTRKIMQIYGQTPEVALVTPILEGISGDGRKMSKSYGNYVAINSDYGNKFGKIMSIPDSLILKYYKAFADIREDEISILERFIEEDPLETKKQLAQFIVSIEAKDLRVGEEERRKFEGKFSSNKNFDDIDVVYGDKDDAFFDLILRLGVFSSKGEIKRLFEQGGVKMIEPKEEIVNMNDKIYDGVLRVGKKLFYRVKIRE